jgi:hypothetical protein
MDGLKSTLTRRWLARLSFVLAGLAIVILLVFAGLKSLAMVVVGLAAAVVGLAAAYFFLSRRSIWRWLSLAVFREARLRAQADSTTIEAPQALLVSNNPYGTVMSTPVTCTISPGALRVWVPRGHFGNCA